jgi:hygromycin-B 7''-O-kinase
MTTSRIYSDRLGGISDEQFALAVSRLGLGEFVSATPTSAGLFGQNVFIATTAGEFVLRGAPHWVRGPDDETWRPQDRWQFTKEAFFARLLHEQTGAPSPWPYLQDHASDIFGWPYAIMPRMPGACFDDRTIREALSPDDQRQVAVAAGAMLAQMQTLTSAFPGDIDVDTIALTPDPDSYVERVIEQTRRLAATARADGVLIDSDMAWIEDVCGRARSLRRRPSVFVHGDYKLNNMTVIQAAGRWRVSGVFDLHTARFGDGAYDLARQTCGYLDSEIALAWAFVDAYRSGGGDDVDLAPRMPLYFVSERLTIWQAFVQADKRPGWSRGKTFRDWTEPYLSAFLRLL